MKLTVAGSLSSKETVTREPVRFVLKASTVSRTWSEPTWTTPLMNPAWGTQKYWKRPGRLNVCRNVWPAGVVLGPEFHRSA